MYKMMIGNVLFVSILACWFIYTDGDGHLLLAGVLMAFGCFISGIVMGYILHEPPKRRVAQVNRAVAATEESAPAYPVEEDSQVEPEGHSHQETGVAHEGEEVVHPESGGAEAVETLDAADPRMHEPAEAATEIASDGISPAVAHDAPSTVETATPPAPAI